eukprot:m.30979 g.30979  ORF g.30979 m.30979 type:complete len:378 (+) comp6873_c0_seq1:66-1199(+)
MEHRSPTSRITVDLKLPRIVTTPPPYNEARSAGDLGRAALHLCVVEQCRVRDDLSRVRCRGCHKRWPVFLSSPAVVFYSRNPLSVVIAAPVPPLLVDVPKAVDGWLCPNDLRLQHLAPTPLEVGLFQPAQNVGRRSVGHQDVQPRGDLVESVRFRAGRAEGRLPRRLVRPISGVAPRMPRAPPRTENFDPTGLDSVVLQDGPVLQEASDRGRVQRRGRAGPSLVASVSPVVIAQDHKAVRNVTCCLEQPGVKRCKLFRGAVVGEVAGVKEDVGGRERGDFVVVSVRVAQMDDADRADVTSSPAHRRVAPTRGGGGGVRRAAHAAGCHHCCLLISLIARYTETKRLQGYASMGGRAVCSSCADLRPEMDLLSKSNSEY